DGDCGSVRISGVVERRPAFHAEPEDASNLGDATYELETVLAARDCPTSWHEVGELGSPVRSEKPCNRAGAPGPIALLAAHVIAGWADLDAAALPIVQSRGNDAWAVDTWRAKPIDLAVGPAQRHAMHVPDHPVVLEWLISHVPVSLLRA